jgi:hypothetical protein
MNCLTSLFIFSGFVFVFCLGLVNVIWDLAEMSVHASPHMLAAPHSGASGAEDGHANATPAYESNSTDLSEIEEHYFATFAGAAYHDSHSRQA